MNGRATIDTLLFIRNPLHSLIPFVMVQAPPRSWWPREPRTLDLGPLAELFSYPEPSGDASLTSPPVGQSSYKSNVCPLDVITL